MGLYDTITVHDDTLCCAAGHSLRDLQTKDMESHLDRWHLVSGTLYMEPGRGGTTARIEYVVKDGFLTVTETHLAAKSDMTATLVVYTSCDDCDPVCYERGESAWG